MNLQLQSRPSPKQQDCSICQTLPQVPDGAKPTRRNDPPACRFSAEGGWFLVRLGQSLQHLCSQQNCKIRADQMSGTYEQQRLHCALRSPLAEFHYDREARAVDLHRCCSAALLLCCDVAMLRCCDAAMLRCCDTALFAVHCSLLRFTQLTNIRFVPKTAIHKCPLHTQEFFRLNTKRMWIPDLILSH